MFESLPLLALTAAGYALKKTGIVDKKCANSLINLVFYIFLPATLIHSIGGMELRHELLIIALTGSLVALSCYTIAYLLTTYLQIPKKQKAPAIIGSGATNQALFLYPFFIAYYGNPGLVYAAFFDMGQAILGISLGYYIAIRAGGRIKKKRDMLKESGKLPVFWGFLAALFVNFTGLAKGESLFTYTISVLSAPTTPLIMVSLGIFLEIKKTNPKPIITTVLTRFVFSIMIAYALINILGLNGIIAKTVLIASTAPPAMLTLIYASKEGLDTTFTATLISISILIGLIYTPILFTVL